MIATTRVGLIGIPWDENSSFMRGAAEAPPLIRAAFASESANPWSETGIDFGATPIFDAHPDIYDEFQGNRYSHACPFARIMEEGLVERLVQVGIRTATGHQREQIERLGVEAVEMKDFRDDLRLEFDTPVYISFDIDGLDPAFAPGVSHREPGGLSTRQALNVIL